MSEAKNDYVVEAVGLTKIFKDFWNREKARAVNGIDFTVKKGQVFGLLGPNGSGKSTTVKMILGLLYPTRGVLKVFGEDPQNVEIKSRIGYLPEETYLYRYLTAMETLDFYGALFGLSPKMRRERSEQLLNMVGLAHAFNRRVGEFSKGMARRIGLAQALVNDPDLVILDEPTSGLDPIGCREVKDVIRLLASRGKTVILCSHLLADVQDVCDDMLVLYGGKVRANGGQDAHGLPDVERGYAERVARLAVGAWREGCGRHRIGQSCPQSGRVLPGSRQTGSRAERRYGRCPCRRRNSAVSDRFRRRQGGVERVASSERAGGARAEGGARTAEGRCETVGIPWCEAC